MTRREQFNLPKDSILEVTELKKREHVDFVFNTFEHPLIVENERFTATGACEVGNTRKKRDGEKVNDDRVVMDTEKGLFAVIDGVGSGDNSDMAASIMGKELLQAAEQKGSVEIYFQSIHAKVSEKIRTEASGEKNGLVYTAVLLTETDIIIVSVGDTCAIVLDENGNVIKYTEDEVKKIGTKEVVSNYISGNKSGEIKQVLQITRNNGQRVLLFTDGISGNWQDPDIEQKQDFTFNQRAQSFARRVQGRNTIDAIKELGQEILEYQENGGKRDNMGCIIIDINK